MCKKYNKGEWSEFYAFIKVLVDKKINLFDINLEKLDSFYSVIEVQRKENSTLSKYELKNDIIIKETDGESFIIPTEEISGFIKLILEGIKNTGGASFAINSLSDLFKLLGTDLIKEGTSYDKADITLLIQDETVTHNIGFNIKSYLGNHPTLLNSSKATNFVYEVIGFEGDIEEVNCIDSRSKIRDRIAKILKQNGELLFVKIDNNVFEENLLKIDTLMSKIISFFLLEFFKGNGRKISEISVDFNELEKNSNINFSNLEYKFKSFLTNVALGFVPTKEWDGYKKANGYIVVKHDGEMGCFSIFDEKLLANYLFNNTVFDTPSSSRHDYGYLYKENGKLYIKLNLQIRL